MVLVITGVLTVVAIPKLADISVFQSRGFTDQVRSALQYAQKTAIAQRRDVCVDIVAGVLNLTRAPAPGAGAACSAGVIDPSTNGAFVLTAPSGVTLSVVSFRFDALGQPSAAVAVTVQGDVARTITVEQITGHVH
jgi:MSHA pilin protein MshC